MWCINKKTYDSAIKYFASGLLNLIITDYLIARNLISIYIPADCVLMDPRAGK
jgi:hypothetical protein